MVGRDRWARREERAAGPAVPPYPKRRHFDRYGSTSYILRKTVVVVPDEGILGRGDGGNV